MKKLFLIIMLLINTKILLSQLIGAGSNSGHTLAIKPNGTVFSWGKNNYGQLGYGDSISSSRNLPVAVLSNGVLNGKFFLDADGGFAHSIAVATNGKVYSWGRNVYGQLGNGNADSLFNYIPVAVDTSGVLSGKTITQIAAGYDHSLALATDGKIYGWGWGSMGELGFGGWGGNRSAPVAVDTTGVLSGKTITQIAGGRNHTIALSSEGKIYFFGMNAYGQSGSGADINVIGEYYSPVAVDTSGVLSGKTITQIAAGANFSLALATNGRVYGWGENPSGQLGNGNNTNINVPVAVYVGGALNGKTITQIAAGESYAIALGSDGTLYTWGNNDFGQLGDGTTTSSNVPIAVSTVGALGGKSITQIAAGAYFTVAVGSDGTVNAWGKNDNGQLGNGTNTDSSVPIAANLSGIGGALPVELKSFSARTQNNNAILSWKTATETNNSGFEVERLNSTLRQAQGSRNWEKITFVRGSGTSNVEKSYTFTDNNLRTGKYSYRLKQLDLDGTTEYSKTVAVEVGGIKSRLRTNPNPFNNTTIINFEVAEKTEVTIKLYDILGRVVAEILNNELKEVGKHEVKFNANNLTSGVYLLKSQTNKISQVEKIVLMK